MGVPGRLDRHRARVPGAQGVCRLVSRQERRCAMTAEAELVRRGANHQLWRAFVGTEEVALRLGRSVGSTPLFDPAPIISGAADLAARLGLSSIAPLIATGS